MFMMKTLLFVCMLLLPAATVSVQGLARNEANQRSTELKSFNATKLSDVSENTPSLRRITIDNDEKLVGYYTGDELGGDNDKMNFTDPKDVGAHLKAGILLTSDMLTRFVGGQITKARFAVYDPWGASVLRIYKTTKLEPHDDNLTEISTTDVANVVKGWNDVTLAKPITVESGVNYLISYDLIQEKDKAGILNDKSVNPDNTSDKGFFVYGPLGTNYETDWWNMYGTGSYGNVEIQAVVKGGKFIDYDAAVASLNSDKFTKIGQTLNFNFSLSSKGNKDITDYSLKVKIDGKDVSANVNAPTTLTATPNNVTGTFTLPSDLAVGRHALTVTVDKINGETPTDNTFDDEQTVNFVAYSQSIARQKNLIEHFTSQYCTNCPGGYDFLNALMSKRNDLVWVSVHGDMGAQLKDEYTLPESKLIDAFEMKSYPQASFNRGYIDNTEMNYSKSLAVDINFGSWGDYYAGWFSTGVIDDQATTLPNFITLNVNTLYNVGTRSLEIKVEGKGIKDAQKLIGDDAVVNVYLTEDSLVSKQLNGSEWIKDYKHDHVLRAMITGEVGENAKWDGDNFENDYTTTLPDTWKAENMNVVAFISRPIIYDKDKNAFETKIDDASVFNTETVKVTANVTTGVNSVKSDKAHGVISRYTADGRKIALPVKGLNILKMSDGTVRKVVIR